MFIAERIFETKSQDTNAYYCDFIIQERNIKCILNTLCSHKIGKCKCPSEYIKYYMKYIPKKRFAMCYSKDR